MGDHEVLAASLADQARIAAVAGDVLPDGPPEVLEGPGRTGEVDTGHVLVRERDPRQGPAAAGDHVDDARWETSGFQQPHQEVRGELLGVGRLPDHDVAEQGWRRGQVPGDRGEVERRDREHEAFQRPVLEPVPRTWRRGWLLGEQSPGVVNVVAPEID